MRNITVNIDALYLLPVGVLLVILKLAKISPISEWSWWIVTIPLYLPVVVAFIAIVLFFVIERWEEDDE